MVKRADSSFPLLSKNKAAVEPRGANRESIPSVQDVQTPSKEFLTLNEKTTPIDIAATDVLLCSNDDFCRLLDKIREDASVALMPRLMKKRGKRLTKREITKLQEEINIHKASIALGKQWLNNFLDDVNDRLSNVRREEFLLVDYYKTLDENIKSAEKEWLPKNDEYHKRHRKFIRKVPLRRYVAEKLFLEGRLAKLNEVCKEIEMKERMLGLSAINDNNTTGELKQAYDIIGTATSKLGIYDDGAGGGSLKTRLQLDQMLQTLQTLSVMPPDPHIVQSRLRKSLILPFSARVLALEIKDNNNAGERFVEWYVNSVIDPLAMAQLVELVPREYLVRTTVRLFNACDSFVDLKRARTLPDVLHVILEAVAEGNSKAFASLLLSSSNSCMRVPTNKEHLGIIFFAALITGQVEVLRRLMFFGFYHVNALIVWLFLNPNLADSNCKRFLTDRLASLNKYDKNEAQIMQGIFNDSANFSVVAESRQLLSELVQNDVDEKFLPLNGRCEMLRRFVCNNKMLRSSGEGDSDVIYDMASTVTNEKNNGVQFEKTQSPQPPPLQLQPQNLRSSVFCETATTAMESARSSHVQLLDESSEISFSTILQQKKLDILCLSLPKCAVLPAASTSFMRRVDACGYTPLKANKLHYFLVGDTSTANAHIVRLPPQHVNMWPDDDPSEAPRLKLQRIQLQTAGIKKRKMQSFYYEAHISLSFLLNDVPLSEELFDPKSYYNAQSLEEKKDLYQPLQTSNVFVGWCSEECVAAADGLSSHPPLGSDSQSIGISFDVLHRAKIDKFTEEIILRPQKHTRGQSTVYDSLDEIFCKKTETVKKQKQEDNNNNDDDDDDDNNNSDGDGDEQESSNKSLYIPLLRLRLEKTNLEDSDSCSDSPSSRHTLSPVIVEQKEQRIFQEFCTPVSSSMRSSELKLKECNISAVEFIDVNLVEECCTPFFTSFKPLSTVINELPVYNLQVLVVGCHVNVETQHASFTINGTSLGNAFTLLPSTVALRPAVSIQSSERMTEILQRVKPADSAIVRFIFEKPHMLDFEKETRGLFFSQMTNSSEVAKDGTSTAVSDVIEVENKSIPGLFPILSPILFDKSMADCGFFRLISCLESSVLTSDCNYDESLKYDGQTYLLGTTTKITGLSVRQMLNTSSDCESLLFFPPVFIRRRSDNAISESNRVAIIPENSSLVPLCIALAQRQRILAYRIALHPFTDFQKTDEESIRQRRMAVRTAAALGYVEVLYVLLERLFVFEFLLMFGLSISSDHPDYLSTGKNLRIFLLDECRQISSITISQRLEYTPLHCAILEEQHDCVHLLLYYINRLLPDKYKQHAVNVLTRSGETALVMACRLGYTKMAKRLLAFGASPSAFDRVTRSNCLELACASRSEEIALTLLQTSEYRFSVAVNLAGVASPLCWCALYNIGSLVRPLIMNGADLDVTLDGLTPLLLAVTFGSKEAALELLNCCEVKTSVQMPLSSCTTASLPKPTLQRKKSIVRGAIRDDEGRFLAVLDVDRLDPVTQSSALHLACELGQFEVANALIEKGASLNLQNKSKYANPLQVAIMSGNEKIALAILEYAKAKLRRGSNVLDIAAIENNGNTALHLAAKMGMLQVIEYIMSQFNDEEITRLCEIRNFTKVPNSIPLTTTNKQNRTPLIVAIYAHQEAAAQLIASLMPDSLSNPGGAIVDGTCTAILASDAEGLDNLTLFFLSKPGYVAQEEFRDSFFARYNAKRREIDLKEDCAANEQEGVTTCNLQMTRDRSKTKIGTIHHYSCVGRGRRGGNSQKKGRCFSTFRSRTSVLPLLSSEKLNNVPGFNKQPSFILLQRQAQSICEMPITTANQRRCSTFIQMLFAKGGTGLVTRASFKILERGFPVEELYAMVDFTYCESLMNIQSVNAVQYAETIISFLREYGGMCVASSDAVMFAKQLRGNSQFVGLLKGTKLIEAKRKLTEVRPLCRDVFYIIRTRGKHYECVEDIRHMITQRGISGAALTEELTSPFGITALQLAATLGLSSLCELFLIECGMDPLHVSSTTNCFCSATKWLLTPFRLALRSLNVETVSTFLCCDCLINDVDKKVDHKELLKADSLQQTALQELISMPLYTLDNSTNLDVLHLIRILIKSGAVVQGNFDSSGNDAWMLAVRASPGKGTQLRLFLAEHVCFNNEFSDDYQKEKKKEENNNNLDIKTATRATTEKMSITTITTTEFTKEIDNEQKKEEKEKDEDEDEDGNNSNEVQQSQSSIDKEMFWDHTGSSWDVLPSFSITRTLKRSVSLNQETYFAQLLFLCAEYNPQCLCSLLGQYSDVFSLSALHPLTGDSLIFYLLQKASNIYFEECGNNDLLISRINRETPLQLTPLILTGIEKKKNTCIETAPYRDPLTIPNVRFLLLVVENLLRTFKFTNLFYMRNDGQTALLLAASLSCNAIVSLIVRQGALQASCSSNIQSDINKEIESSKSVLSESKNIFFGTSIINNQLAKNLEAFGCWEVLASRLYYTEEEMDTLMIILDHITNLNVKYSFLSLVYSNLHPILALRIAVLYAKNAKHFLIHPEAVNAFWSNVLYAQYVGRLEEVIASSPQWKIVLNQLIPTASAIPIYLIKSTLFFSGGLAGANSLTTTPRESFSGAVTETPTTTTTTATTPTPTPTTAATIIIKPDEKEKRKKINKTNWKFISTRTDLYIQQLAAAAVCTASPASALAAAHHNSGVVPASQRHVLMTMTSFFHELIELTVRFDNFDLLKALVNFVPDELQSCIKYEWRALMEKCKIDVTAIAAGSINTLRFLVDNPETSLYFYKGRYDRIDPLTGFAEEAGYVDEIITTTTTTTAAAAAATTGTAGVELLQSRRSSAVLIKRNSVIKRGGLNNSFSAHPLIQKGVSKTPVMFGVKGLNKKTNENKQAVVNILSVDSNSFSLNTDSVYNDDKSESSLQCFDIMATTRERLPVSAVTWGIGAAARPIALQNNSKQTPTALTPVQNFTPLSKISQKKTAETVGHEVIVKLQTPRGNEDKMSSRASTRRRSIAVGAKKRDFSLSSQPVAVTEQPCYFAFYLCDWALHTTLLLRSLRPSLKTIDTLLYLLDLRVPITASVVYFFLAASRPLNNWVSSDGQHISLNYVTRTHKDTLLHLLVQNNQFELARYFLAAALYYFAQYQYDLPTSMPPKFSLFDLSQLQDDAKPVVQNAKAKKMLHEQNELTEDDSVYPAVFLRSMMRVNKHGLTPFDYAHGPMVSLLTEYGCIPPSYRPNPSRFCHEIRLEKPCSAFHSVPRLLLVSYNFLELHDDEKKKSYKSTSNGLFDNITDAVIMRNQAISQQTTKTDILPSLFTDNVSLLHLGLCSVDDELVLHNINKKRQKQMKMLMNAKTTEPNQIYPVSLTMKHHPFAPLELQQVNKVDFVGIASSATWSTPGTPNSRVKNDGGVPPVLKLLDALNERNIVAFPLLLSLEDDIAQSLDNCPAEDGTAIFVSMTLMTLAQHAGVVKREERTQVKKKTWNKKRSTSPQEELINTQLQVPSRFTEVTEKTTQPAELLESWVASRRSAKHAGSGKDPHVNLLAKAFGTGIAGRTVRALGLSTAPCYQQP